MIGVGNFILAIVIGIFAAICLFILVLLARLLWRRNVPSHGTPGVSSGRMPGRLGWTATLLVLVALVAVPAVRLWYSEKTVPVADLTVQITGKMWSWTYKYPDQQNLSFEAPMLATPAPGAAGERGRSDASNHIVVPVGKTVRIVTMGGSLIYSWAIPSIGAKVTALPGQTNQSWFRAGKEGRYYGKCTELCGLPHLFKPVEIEVVSPERFDRWAAQMRLRLAATKPAPLAADER